MREINRRKIGTICLVIATFLNPFGYDILVFKLNQLTNDYWTTMHIMYASALLFFGLFLYFFKINPITYFKFKIKTIKELLKSKFNKNGQNL